MTNREIDALIAEKVMGLQVVKTTNHNKVLGPVSYYSIGEPDWGDDAGEMYLSNPLLAYSGDIGAAWEIIEALKTKSLQVRVLYSDTDHDGTYSHKCEFFDRDGNSYFSNAQTAPLAICLAALKAVGVTTGGL